MNRLIFLNRFYSPDHSATSQLLSDLTFDLAAAGNEVHVITSQQRYDDPAARLRAEETIRGVNVHRVSSTQFGRSALLGRGIDYLSFYASMWRSTLKLADKGDVLIAKTDPPLTSVPAMAAAKRRGAKLVNWLQDLYPEVAVELGVPLIKGPVARVIAAQRDRSLKFAAANVAVGRKMAERVIARGADERQVHVITNWCDDEEVRPVARGDNPLRRHWQLQDKFVVGYSGNLGRAHEFATVLAAAGRLKDNPRIVFLMVGGGHQMDTLSREVKARGLVQSFRFFPYQERELLRHSLAVADVHWISLKPEVEGLIVPSKVYGIAAVGRPIIAITAKDGEIAALVDRYQCGLVIEPGKSDDLANALSRLSARPDETASMGERARAMLEAHFSRRLALERWRGVLDQVRS